MHVSRSPFSGFPQIGPLLHSPLSRIHRSVILWIPPKVVTIPQCLKCGFQAFKMGRFCISLFTLSHTHHRFILYDRYYHRSEDPSPARVDDDEPNPAAKVPRSVKAPAGYYCTSQSTSCRSIVYCRCRTWKDTTSRHTIAFVEP